uniref:Uncharacterized protein n=1 Tax=Arundo donax TaxID=35708 RepID=A0A0A8YKQ9_ARUDO
MQLINSSLLWVICLLFPCFSIKVVLTVLVSC